MIYILPAIIATKNGITYVMQLVKFVTFQNKN